MIIILVKQTDLLRLPTRDSRSFNLRINYRDLKDIFIFLQRQNKFMALPQGFKTPMQLYKFIPLRLRLSYYVTNNRWPSKLKQCSYLGAQASAMYLPVQVQYNVLKVKLLVISGSSNDRFGFSYIFRLFHKIISSRPEKIDVVCIGSCAHAQCKVLNFFSFSFLND